MRKLLAILAIAAMTISISPVVAYAASSPQAETKDPNLGSGEQETKDGDTDREYETKNPNLGPSGGDSNGGNTGDKSPQTGDSTGLVFVAMLGAAGVALVARKKVTE